MALGFKARYRLLIIGQILVIFSTVTAISVCFVATDWLAIPLILAAALVIELVVLFRFLEASVVALEDFLEAISFADFTQRFSRTDVDQELSEAFNRILERFRRARADTETQSHYLELVVKHVPVPLLGVRQDGSVSLVNHPFRQLVGGANPKTLEQLASVNDSLPRELGSLVPGERRLIQTSMAGRPVELRVSVAELRLAGGAERLYAIENIGGELSDRESSAWRNLIRVLTHEIMNTMTPVTSLAHTAEKMVQEGDHAEDIEIAVATIAKRSEHLMAFVQRYRELMRLPHPEIRQIPVKDALVALENLLHDELHQLGIEFALDVEPSSLEVSADGELLDQVLINLVRNAIDALEGHSDGRIDVGAYLDRGHLVISVGDNGCGIAPDTREQMFVPFFTTKREGSGIGLAVSRQIMNAHGGAISVDSTPGEGATFKLIF